jgi:uncharacterized membrane protein
MAGPLTTFLHRRWRLALALALGIAAGLVAPHEWIAGEPFRRFLIGWNITVWSYLVLIGALMLRADASYTRALSEREDPSAALVLAIVSLVAFTSLLAIGAELASARDAADRVARYLFAGLTLAGSWLMVNTLFAFHYAHLYFRNPRAPRPLRFPDEPPPDPDFWDFLYFSFTLAVAAQTSDVAVVSSAVRRTVLAHSVLAFVFNVAILGATINVVAGLLGTR